LSSIAAEYPRPLRNFVIAGICLLALAWVAAMQPSTAPVPTQDAAVAASAPLTPKLAALAQSDPGRRVDVIVRLQPGVSAEATRSFVSTAGGHAGESIGLINAFSARLRASDAQRVASQPGVFAVSLNGATKPQATSLKPSGLATSFNQSVKTPRVWKHATGKGIGVALIDTGVAGGLADFRRANGSGSRVVASAVTHPDATTAEDKYGHGTHVAGLIAGDSSRRPAGDPLRGRYAGTAPGADLISIKASDDHGEATILDVIYGIEFAVEHKDEFNIRVLNLSLESTVAESYRTDPLAAAVEAAWFKGIVVVAAAGNRGSDADAVDYAPGNDPYVISVGAVDDQGTKQTRDDLRTDWSSRGTTQDGHAKPELYAPGARMVSNLAPDSDFASMCAECVSDDGQYIRAGGTSMSAPVVAGVVATLLEEHPSWTPDQVKGAIVNNLRALPGGGHELDAFAAFNASRRELTSNQGLEPSEIVDPATGDVAWDRSRWSRSRWSRSRWSRSRWSAAAGTLSPSWAGASYVCDCEMIDPDTGEVDPTRSRWSRSRWSRSRWSRSRWSTHWAY
jgi:serine protease AprX